MKTSTTNFTTEQQIETLTKRDLVLIKTSIAVFGLVLNICFIQLFF
jgi:hypothetical protein